MLNFKQFCKVDMCDHAVGIYVSRLAAVDGSGVMVLYNIETLSGQAGSAEGILERKDVWSVKWAEVRCLD